MTVARLRDHLRIMYGTFMYRYVCGMPGTVSRQPWIHGSTMHDIASMLVAGGERIKI